MPEESKESKAKKLAAARKKVNGNVEQKNLVKKSHCTNDTSLGVAGLRLGRKTNT